MTTALACCNIVGACVEKEEICVVLSGHSVIAGAGHIVEDFSGKEPVCSYTHRRRPH